MTKFYLAASYPRHPELQSYAKELQALGHEITSRWIWGEHAAQDGDIMGTGNAEFASMMAMEDEEDVWKCDTFIHFTNPPDDCVKRGGAHVEFGMARALGKRLIIVGHYTNIFHRLDVVNRVGRVEGGWARQNLKSPRFCLTWSEAYNAIARGAFTYGK